MPWCLFWKLRYYFKIKWQQKNISVNKTTAFFFGTSVYIEWHIDEMTLYYVFTFSELNSEIISVLSDNNKLNQLKRTLNLLLGC